jgi:outer membrane murein-binding lipoprotein Lpp
MSKNTQSKIDDLESRKADLLTGLEDLQAQIETRRGALADILIAGGSPEKPQGEIDKLESRARSFELAITQAESNLVSMRDQLQEEKREEARVILAGLKREAEEGRAAIIAAAVGLENMMHRQNEIYHRGQATAKQGGITDGRFVGLRITEYQHQQIYFLLKTFPGDLVEAAKEAQK